MSPKAAAHEHILVPNTNVEPQQAQARAARHLPGAWAVFVLCLHYVTQGPSP